MLVSVIIPCYNSEKYLQETLDSVFNQSYSPIEVICVDNGSTDGTIELIQKNLEKHNNLFLYNESEKGASYARNKGFYKSKGEIIQFLDSDDIITKEKLGNQVRHMIENNCDVVVSDREVRDERLENKIVAFEFSHLKCNPLKTALTEIIITGNPIYKRDIVQEVGSYTPQLQMAQDYDFHIKLFMTKPKTCYLKGTYLISRQLSNSLSSNWVDVGNTACSVLKKYKNELFKLGVYKDKDIYLQILNMYLISSLHIKEREIRKEFINEISDWSKSFQPWDVIKGYKGLFIRLFGLKSVVFFKRLFNRY